MNSAPNFQMTPATARRLFQVFTDADLIHHLKGTRHADYLRKAARQHLGQTRKYLLRVAALEDDVPLFMSYFLEDEPGSMEKFIEATSVNDDTSTIQKSAANGWTEMETHEST